MQPKKQSANLNERLCISEMTPVEKLVLAEVKKASNSRDINLALKKLPDPKPLEGKKRWQI